jgi:hypothetical protein
VRHNRLLAAGIAAALMLGAASPALAAGKAKGKATAPGQAKPKPAKPAKPEKQKPAKKTKSGVSGGGVVGGAEFSIQARLRDIKDGTTSKGHFNYTTADGLTTIRCRGFNSFAADTATGMATVPFKNCTLNGQAIAGGLQVMVDDNGQPNYEAVPAVADAIDFTATAGAVTVDVMDAALTDGNVKVR